MQSRSNAMRRHANRAAAFSSNAMGPVTQRGGAVFGVGAALESPWIREPRRTALTFTSQNPADN